MSSCSAIAVYLLWLAAWVVTAATVPGIFYPFGPDAGDSFLPDHDDGLSSAQYIQTGFPFFNISRSVVFVSTAALVTFICPAPVGDCLINCPRQCLWCCHHGRAIERVHPVHLMNIEWRQAAADPRPSQTT